MRAIYESIITKSNASFNVESYMAATNCRVAGWHIHPEYELVYVKNGAGTLRIGNKIYNYKDGTVIFLAGHIPHSDFGNKQYKDGKEVVIQFSSEFVNKKLKLFPEFSKITRLIKDSESVLIFDNDIKTQLSSQFEQLSKQNHAEKLITLFSILNTLSEQKEFISLFTNDIHYRFREKETYRLRSVFQFVNTHYPQRITAREISSKVGLTPNSFSRFFKKMTNRTFIDFLNEFRVSKAMEELQKSDTTIMEAMYKSGFKSPSYFSKQFFKYQKVKPSTYVRNLSHLERIPAFNN